MAKGQGTPPKKKGGQSEMQEGRWKVVKILRRWVSPQKKRATPHTPLFPLFRGSLNYSFPH